MKHYEEKSQYFKRDKTAYLSIKESIDTNLL